MNKKEIINQIQKGIYFSSGIFIFLGIMLGLVYATGFHSANEIVTGTFNGNYNFIGNINFTDASVEGLGASGGSTPPGSIMAFATPTCPADWLEANGSSISTSTYSDLHGAINYMYGGSGASFSLPDYRGYFLRGWDKTAGNDPNSATRIDRGDGTTGDNIGTKQIDDFYQHLHGVNPPSTLTNNIGAHQHTSYNQLVYDLVSKTIFISGTDTNFRYGQSGLTSSNGNHQHSLDIGLFNSVNSGGSETRPKNINVLYCIKT